MKSTKFVTIATCMDVCITFFAFLLFVVLFLSSLQADLLDSYNTIEAVEEDEYTYATLGSTAQIFLSLVGGFVLFVALYFIGDVIKLRLLTKHKLWKLIWVNGIAWIVFVCLLLVVALIMQEIYIFFALIGTLKFVFFFLLGVLSVLLIFTTLVLGKKHFWHKKRSWRTELRFWAIAAGVFGVICAIQFTFLVVIAVGALSVFHNWRLQKVL